MTEAELAEKFIEYFTNYEIYKEVPTFYGRCDFFAILQGLYISVEVKKQFSTKVIYQAFRNFGCSHYAYVAVPYSRNNYEAIRICEMLGIGVLIYRPENVNDPVQIALHAAYRRKICKPGLVESMKLAIAGAQHNSQSQFKVTIELIELFIKRNGGSISLNELFANSSYHYTSPKHAKQAIVRYVKQGILKQFSINKGVIICQ